MGVEMNYLWQVCGSGGKGVVVGGGGTSQIIVPCGSVLSYLFGYLGRKGKGQIWNGRY